jgi:hypothetical protein
VSILILGGRNVLTVLPGLSPRRRDPGYVSFVGWTLSESLVERPELQKLGIVYTHIDGLGVWEGDLETGLAL